MLLLPYALKACLTFMVDLYKSPKHYHFLLVMVSLVYVISDKGLALENTLNLKINFRLLITLMTIMILSMLTLMNLGLISGNWPKVLIIC